MSDLNAILNIQTTCIYSRFMYRCKETFIMGFFWANVKANIEGAVANAKMHYYEDKLRSDDYDEDEEEDYNEVQEEYNADSIEDSPVANIQNNWKSILLVLQTEYNIQDIQMSTWIKPLRVENVEDNILNLSFRNADDNEQEHNMNVKYVQKRFADLLSDAIAEYMDTQYVVKIK